MATTLATAAGLVLGILAALIWKGVSARMARTEFWASFTLLTSSLLATDGDHHDFLRHYGQLLRLLIRYLGRNALLVVSSSMPVIFCLWLLPPSVMENDHRQAQHHQAKYPPQPVTLSIAREKSRSDRGSRVSEPMASVSVPEICFDAALVLGSIAGMIVLPARPR
jgi:hypothetical protein